MASREEIIDILRKSDAVCFDVDSTVCTGEGIDELAEFCDRGTLVKEMTLKAMSGNMDFREALSMRLNIIQPSQSQIHKMLQEKPLQLTSGIQELFKVLRANQKQLYMVSGGFDCLIHPLATQLGLPTENVFANKLKFYYDGQYAGFDENQFTSRSGGKRLVIDYLKKNVGHSIVVMIGDGITDLETCPTADAFIGFGGNIVREAVKNKSSCHNEPPPPYAPLVQQPPGSYGAIGTPTTIIVNPVPTETIVLVGGCPACRVGVLESDYTCLGLLCFILFFPIGIICCMAFRQRRCHNCGAVF